VNFFGQPDDGLHTGPKHVVVSYILLLIVILLCSWLRIYIDIYTLQLCIIDLTQRGWHRLRFVSCSIVRSSNTANPPSWMGTQVSFPGSIIYKNSTCFQIVGSSICYPAGVKGPVVERLTWNWTVEDRLQAGWCVFHHPVHNGGVAHPESCLWNRGGREAGWSMLLTVRCNLTQQLWIRTAVPPTFCFRNKPERIDVVSFMLLTVH